MDETNAAVMHIAGTRSIPYNLRSLFVNIRNVILMSETIEA
jgi:hypothetical protein